MHDEAQTKLREGLRILDEASEEDRDRLGLALIKLHGTLGDYLHFELSQKAPHLRLEGQDASQTSWQDLIRYGQQYLEFSDSDARMIFDAHRQHQHVARGGTYAKSRAELAEYAAFVKRLYTDAGTPGNLVQPVEAIPRAAGAAPGLFTSPETPEKSQPWYRSSLLLIAYFAAFLIFFCMVGFLSYMDTFLEFVRKPFERPTPQSTPTGIPEPLPSPTLTTLPSPTLAVANPNTACVIVWVEHPTDLGRKTRSWVYEQLVSDRVKGTGMTPREFYDQVVERNPVLEADDYEFKSGITYLLPQCQ